MWDMKLSVFMNMNLPLSCTIKRTQGFSFPWRSRFITTCSVSKSDNKDRVIVISGPTGAGKSRLALELAKRLGGEIISADSVQVYRGLDIGSAKPSTSDRNEVPHHLIDILHPSEEYSAGQFFEDARRATKEVLDKGRVPIIAGGTGLYLRWYVYGKPDVPKASLEIASEVYDELSHLQERGDWEAAVDLVVNSGDPKARFVPTNNWYRLRRSLEIIKASGAPPSSFSMPYDAFREQFESRFLDSSDDHSNETNLSELTHAIGLDYNFICFFLTSPRVDLYRSIDLRCEAMLMDTKGLLSESSWLLDLGLLPNMNCATRSIGYRQAMEYLLRCRENGGRSSVDDLFEFLFEFQKASRNFAKRQMTWFRNEPVYQWLDASKPFEEVIDFICKAYHDETKLLDLPKSLRIQKETKERQVKRELMAYSTKLELFMHDDCNQVLKWIRSTQSRKVNV